LPRKEENLERFGGGMRDGGVRGKRGGGEDIFSN
jgi:hypothetical protein